MSLIESNLSGAETLSQEDTDDEGGTLVGIVIHGNVVSIRCPLLERDIESAGHYMCGRLSQQNTDEVDT